MEETVEKDLEINVDNDNDTHISETVKKEDILEERRCKERYSYLTTTLLGLLSLSLLIALVVVVSKRADAGHKKHDPLETYPEVCLTPECVSTSWSVLSKMATETEDGEALLPCEDMYHLACGRWLKEAIPPGASKWTMFSELTRSNQLKLLKLVLTNATDVGGVPSTAVLKMKIVYRTCMDVNTIESQRASRLLKLMSTLGHWTVTPPPSGQSGWDSNHWSLQSSLIMTHILGTGGLFQTGVRKDSKVKDKNAIMITQSGLTLALREEYGDGKDKFKDGFLDYATTVGVLLGGDKNDVRTKMENIYSFEKNISKIFVGRRELINPLKTYHKYRLVDFQKLLGHWIDIKEHLSGVYTDVRFTDEYEVLVHTPEYFKHLGEKVMTADNETLANYLVWRVVHSTIDYLPDAFSRAALHLKRVEFGVTSLRVRWKKCLGFAQQAVPFVVSALYVSEHFSPASKVKVVSALDQIRRQFIVNLDSVTWLDEVTKSKLKVKAEAMTLSVGYPDWIIDPTKLDHRYQKLQVEKGEQFQNYLNANAYYLKIMINELKKPDRDKWLMKPSDVNAYYQPDYNRVVVPAGILQPPWFSPHYPDGLLYGAIGVLIGHELTHGFDSGGRLYDENGCLGDTWTSEASQGFHNASLCMEDQYSKYKLFGLHLDGKFTLNENIADNGGLKLAWAAYQNHKNSLTSSPLPGLNYTEDQMFFIGFSQTWCSHVTPRSAAYSIRTSKHSFGLYRVIGSLSNSEEFSRAFGCKPGSSLFKRNKCSVW